MSKFIQFILSFLPKKLRIKIKSLKNLGYVVNISNPKTFNEKIAYRKCQPTNPLFTLCADKLAVREYVADKIGDRYLIPLLYSGKELSPEILGSFGNNIIVKANHDSGKVFILKDAAQEDLNKICKEANALLNNDFGKKTDENWYSSIEPKLIIERLLQKKCGSVPEDYKFHVFNKKKIILQVDYDRFIEHNRTFYDLEGNILPFSIKYPNKNRPLQLKKADLLKMQNLAIALADDFDYVRVDFYLVEDDVFFGELTFAHESGFGKFNPVEFDAILGSYW